MHIYNVMQIAEPSLFNVEPKNTERQSDHHNTRMQLLQKKATCPLENNCLTSSIVYNAKVTTTEDPIGNNYI